MTGIHRSLKLEEFKAQPEAGGDSIRELLKGTRQEILAEEMTEASGAAKGERTADQAGYRLRSLTTRVGRIELRVP